jgi:hypothetical protein
VSTARAAVIANWGFQVVTASAATDSATYGPLNPDSGAGSFTGNHASAVTDWTTPSGNGSTFSVNVNTWAIGDYFQMQVATTGQSGISISWDQTRSSAGPGQPSPTTPNFRLQYSTDGTNFTNVVDYLVPVVTWNNTTADGSTHFSQDLSAVTALDNQPAVYFRLTAIQAPQNTGGQSRVDNIVVTTVPEPASGGIALVSMVTAAAALRRLQRKAKTH